MKEKRKRKKKQNKNKTKKPSKFPLRDLNLHPNLRHRKISGLIPLGHCTVIVLKYFSLAFTLFEPRGTVFIMYLKTHLRKNSLNEYFNSVSHYFRLYLLSGFTTAAR